MFCNKCGNELREKDLFCSKCGNKIDYINNDTNDKKVVEISDSNVIESKEFTQAVNVNPGNYIMKHIGKILLVLIGMYIIFTMLFIFAGVYEFPIFMHFSIIGATILYGFNEYRPPKYTGKCPHCKSDLIAYGEGFNCVMCGRRIIVKDNKFYKV